MIRSAPTLLAPIILATLCQPPPAAAHPAAPRDDDLVFRGRPVVGFSVDATLDDLATAGLGFEGLRSAEPPLPDDPLRPTVDELRRLAIWSNYRALVDTSPGGGYGTFYGPGVPLAPGLPAPPEKIAGDEFLTFANSSGLSRTVTLMVQVPDSFDPARACLVTGASSGSRNVYGAIGTAGEWGLKRGCAVAYTDKGGGIGAHDLEDDTVNRLRGERELAEVAGEDSNFTARLTPAQQAAFNAETPHRFAFKHAHSQRNPEALWGVNVLQAIEFALFILNEAILPERHPGAPPLTPADTIVIASSVSNGGGAALLAAERDTGGLIDGVAVSEPNVNPEVEISFVIRQEGRAPLAMHSKSLLGYTTVLNLYQGCANLAPANAAAPLNLTPIGLGEARCTSLAEKGLLAAGSVQDQAAEAQTRINDAGILPEQNLVQPSHWFLRVPQAVAVTYANTYGRFSVLTRLCGYGFGATDPASGQPVPLAEDDEAILFGTANGIPPTGGVDLINEDSQGGPQENRVSTSPSTSRADQNLDGALCLRALATGRDPVSGRRLSGVPQQQHFRILNGIAQIRASGDLDGTPALLVHGRADAILPPNHTSRAYFGLNRTREGSASGLRYYEVLNAQHLDALNPVAGFDNRFVPLHHYFFEVMNLMWAHLIEGQPLPPSQVVRAVPRGGAAGAAPPLAAANLPPIAADPPAGDRITFDGAEVFIPD